MSSTSTIEWTDATWNPVRGCTEVSPGCARCYAKVFAERWRGIPGHAYEQGFDPRLAPERLLDPLRWRKPRRIFVNSMSDLWHESVPSAYVEAVFDVMALADWHVFQILTKRAARMFADLHNLQQAITAFGDASCWPLPNVWLGVSAENRRHGLPRLDYLRQTAAAKRFVSAEPLLEDLGRVDLQGIDWLIVGGESGRRARPMEEAWAQNLRIQAQAAGTAFFFKQWGGPNKKRAGRRLGGREYNEQPPFDVAAVPSEWTRRHRLIEASRLQDKWRARVEAA